MTKVRVISMFHDKMDYSHVFEVGQVVDFDDEARVHSIVEHGLGEIVEAEERKESASVKDENPIAEVEEVAPKPKRRTTKRNGK